MRPQDDSLRCSVNGVTRFDLQRRRFNSGTKDSLSLSELCVHFISSESDRKVSDIDIRSEQESPHLTSLSGALYTFQFAAENR